MESKPNSPPIDVVSEYARTKQFIKRTLSEFDYKYTLAACEDEDALECLYAPVGLASEVASTLRMLNTIDPPCSDGTEPWTRVVRALLERRFFNFYDLVSSKLGPAASWAEIEKAYCGFMVNYGCMPLWLRQIKDVVVGDHRIVVTHTEESPAALALITVHNASSAKYVSSETSEESAEINRDGYPAELTPETAEIAALDAVFEAAGTAEAKEATKKRWRDNLSLAETYAEFEWLREQLINDIGSTLTTALLAPIDSATTLAEHLATVCNATSEKNAQTWRDLVDSYFIRFFASYVDVRKHCKLLTVYLRLMRSRIAPWVSGDLLGISTIPGKVKRSRSPNNRAYVFWVQPVGACLELSHVTELDGNHVAWGEYRVHGIVRRPFHQVSTHDVCLVVKSKTDNHILIPIDPGLIKDTSDIETE